MNHHVLQEDKIVKFHLDQRYYQDKVRIKVLKIYKHCDIHVSILEVTAYSSLSHH